MNRKQRRAVDATGHQHPNPMVDAMRALNMELVLSPTTPMACIRCRMRKGDEAALALVIGAINCPPSSMTPDGFGGVEVFWEYSHEAPRGDLVRGDLVCTDQTASGPPDPTP